MQKYLQITWLPKIGIISDRDAKFNEKFWREFFKQVGTSLNMSSTYHPQTDGQTEVVNKCLEAYLRCFVTDKQNHWSQWLHLTEWWYNSTYHTSVKRPLSKLYMGMNLQIGRNWFYTKELTREN